MSDDEFAAQPSGEALRLLNDEYLNARVNEAKQDAVDALLHVDPYNAAQIARHQGQFAALDSLMMTLKTLSEGKQKHQRGDVA